MNQQMKKGGDDSANKPSKEKAAALGPEEAAKRAASEQLKGQAGGKAKVPTQDEGGPVITEQIKILEKKLEGLKEENAKLNHQFRLAIADRENEKRIMNKSISDAEMYAVASFAKDIVAACDNLERIAANLDEADKLHSGIVMTWNELQKALSSHGVTMIDAYGRAFDPEVHQAVAEIPSDKAKSGTVIEVLQHGYKIHGRLLRPSLVNVAKAPKS